MSTRALCAVVAMLASLEAAAACSRAGSSTTCTVEPGVTRTQRAGRIETSNALVGAAWERYRVDGAGYTYSFGTDPEGKRWVSAKRKPAGSAFLLWDNRKAPAPAPAPAPVPAPLPMGVAPRD